jgi:hypothetical protein
VRVFSLRWTRPEVLAIHAAGLRDLAAERALAGDLTCSTRAVGAELDARLVEGRFRELKQECD